MPFLPPNQQRQSTEGKALENKTRFNNNAALSFLINVTQLANVYTDVSPISRVLCINLFNCSNVIDGM